MPISSFSSSNNKNKNNFLLGLLAGVAGLAIIGMIVFGILYFTNKNNETDKKEEVADEQQENVQPQVELKISDNDWVLGNKDAKVKIFEFSDFQCPYCARFHGVMHQVAEEFPNDVAWIFKQFPIASHPLGMPGAVATECAGEQNKFWEMSDMIFTNQQGLTEDDFEDFADEIGLDTDQYNACVLNNTYRDKIENDYQTGIKSGVRGTPSNFINGKMVPGAVPFESMKQMVEELLAE